MPLPETPVDRVGRPLPVQDEKPVAEELREHLRFEVRLGLQEDGLLYLEEGLDQLGQ